MRFWTRLFIAYLLIVNLGVFLALQTILNTTFYAQACFMVLMFWPFVVQIVCAILFFTCLGQQKSRKKQLKKFKEEQKQREMMQATMGAMAKASSANSHFGDKSSASSLSPSTGGYSRNSPNRDSCNGRHPRYTK